MNKKGLIVASFGTSFTDAIEANIVPVENSLKAAFPEYEMRRAFTSRFIRKKLRERDGLCIDSVEEALDRMKADGFTEVLVQPTFIIPGFEYDDLLNAVAARSDDFESLKVGKPLLDQPSDYELLFRGLQSEFAFDASSAYLFMGHGTEHAANACYPTLAECIADQNCDNVFIGTVEGVPDLDQVRAQLKGSGLKTVIMAPLLLVAGDHATHDMAGDHETSWKSILEGDGMTVNCVLKGLGSYAFIGDMFVDHAKDIS